MADVLHSALMAQIGEEVARSLSSAEFTSAGLFIRTPLLYPSGTSVVVRVEGSAPRFFVTDLGMGHQESMMLNASGSFAAIARNLAQDTGISFDNRRFFVAEAARDELVEVVSAVANLSQRAVIETAVKHEERKVDQYRALLIRRLDGAFGCRRHHARGCTVSRNDKICGKLPVKIGAGLEFGPLDKPVIRRGLSEISYADARTMDELRAIVPPETAAGLVEIDYVWRNGVLDTGGKLFDYAVGSHVIEHVPNLIGWLNCIDAVLKPGASLALAIPDKRFTFDVRRTPTTAGTVVGDHIAGFTTPQPHHVFDFLANEVMVDVEGKRALWAGRAGPLDFPLCHRLDDVAATIKEVVANPEHYRECHTYVFTPRSFIELMTMLTQYGYLAWRPIDFCPTERNTDEFIVTLQKPPTLDGAKAEALRAWESVARQPMDEPGPERRSRWSWGRRRAQA